MSEVHYDEIGFFEGYGNDERIYSWPSISIQSAAIQKHPFYEYHTSLDVPDNIDSNSLKEALIICLNFASAIEKNYIPTYTSSIPPYLSKRKLYFDRWRDKENHHKYNNQLLFNINGENSLVDLTQITDLSFNNIWKYLESFYQQGLIDKNPILWDK
jgi:aminopeptidase-like protein